MKAHPWFPLGGPTAQARVSLFCLPHAGGGASAFARWRRHLPPAIDLLALQAPGREERIDEAPCESMAALSAGLAGAMAPYLGRPYALFGHSVGAAVAFELARQLPRKPSHLFLSSWTARAAPARPASRLQLSDRDFLAAMARYGGIPAAVARDAGMMAVLLKPMRADVQILENYAPAIPPRLDCPATILGGRDDPVVAPQQLHRWAGRLQAPPPVLFPGGHFYLRDCAPAVLALVVSTLLAPANAEKDELFCPPCIK